VRLVTVPVSFVLKYLGGADQMRATNVRADGRYKLEIVFEDGIQGTIDLSDLAGSGVFSVWDAPGAFEDVSVGSGGEVVWNAGVDLCADSLYLRLTNKNVDELFPSLSPEHSVA
jgi:hypothetical protein